ncbi:MAG: hypothetical protein M1490_02100 [Candidatus Bathyarchaeota archaeon]|nr:hypothetical protein [Candidatus Bathyarchaeota archaeon]
MKLKKTVLIPLIALVFIAIALSAVTAGVLIAQQSVPAAGTVGGNITSTVNIGVYSDPGATVNCTNIDWGSLNSGDTATKTVYIKNTGNVSETLSMTAINWNPSTATSTLSLTWSQEGTSLVAGEVVPATFTLNVAADTGSLSDFSFNIVISGAA